MAQRKIKLNKNKNESTKNMKKGQKSCKNELYNKKDFPCCLCSHVFDNSVSLIVHMRDHLPEELKLSAISIVKNEELCKGVKNQEVEVKSETKHEICNDELSSESDDLISEENDVENIPCSSEEPGDMSRRNTDNGTTSVDDGMNNSLDNKQFSCDVCGKSYSSQANLNRHKLGHSNSRPTCVKCNKTFKNIYCLNVHQKKSICDRRKLRKLPLDNVVDISGNPVHKDVKEGISDLNLEPEESDSEDDSLSTGNCETDQLISLNRSSWRYKCDVCSKTYSSNTNLIRHKKFHLGISYPCQRCGKSFKNSSYLKEHEKRESCNVSEKRESCNVSEKRESCNVSEKRESCNVSTSLCIEESSVSTQKEIQTKNIKNESIFGQKEIQCFECLLCGKGFAKRNLLKNHMERHDKQFENIQDEPCEKTIIHSIVKMEEHENISADLSDCFICEECGETIVGEKSYEYHRLQHLGSLFSCDKCGLLFHRPDKLHEHMEEHDRSEVNNETQEPDTCVTSIQFHRPDKSNELMEEHGRSEVSNEAQELNTYVSSELDINVRSMDSTVNFSTRLKNKLLPNTCSFCKKTFLNKLSLLEHELCHDKQFVCETCNESFLDSYLLEEHDQIHNSMEVGEAEIVANEICALQRISEENQDLQSSEDMISSTIIPNEINALQGISEENQDLQSSEDMISSTTIPNEMNALQGISEENQDLHSSEDMISSMKSGNSCRSGENKPRRVMYPCKRCEKKFKSRHHLGIHMKRHENRINYKCEKCGKYFATRSGLFNHKKYHDTNKAYVCATCNSIFSTPVLLKKHVRSHHKEKDGEDSYKNEKIRTCELCEILFTCVTNFLRHMKEKHSDTAKKLKFQCDECGKTFLRNEGLKSHLKSHSDTRQKGNECSVCYKAFFTKSNLVRHMRVHTDKPYTCEICGSSFTRSDILSKHIETHSSAHATFKCEICDKIFKQEVNYYRHLKLHTGEKRHMCDECGKAFPRSDTLNNHKKTHIQQDKKPFTCIDCGVYFSAKQQLTRHQQSEKTSTKFQCGQCHKIFTWRKCLKFHFKSHSEDKNTCQLCQETFPSSKTLHEHMLIHREDQTVYICPVCLEQCDSMENWVAHHQSHPRCDMCDIVCWSHNELISHTLEEHPEASLLEVDGTTFEIEIAECIL